MAENKNELVTSGLKRRDFLCKSAVACYVMSNLFSSNDIIAKEQKDKGMARNPEELVTFCGIYCGACDIGQKRIGNAGYELKHILDAYQFSNWVTEIPGFEEYNSFEKTLSALIDFFGQCPGCQQGGGAPDCQIRNCCKEKGIQTCADCASMPCDKLKASGDFADLAINNLNNIKEIGLERWTYQQQKKVDEGLRYSDFMINNKKSTKE